MNCHVKSSSQSGSLQAALESLTPIRSWNTARSLMKMKMAPLMKKNSSISFGTMVLGLMSQTAPVDVEGISLGLTEREVSETETECSLATK